MKNGLCLWTVRLFVMLLDICHFFVTKTERSRVVYDGAAKVDGKSLNQAVLAGENLLNNLLQMLLRFRLDKYACVADVSKCFFKSVFLGTNKICFALFGLKTDLEEGKPQIF